MFTPVKFVSKNKFHHGSMILCPSDLTYNKLGKFTTNYMALVDKGFVRQVSRVLWVDTFCMSACG